MSLSPDEARARGGVTQSPPAEGKPDPGWGYKPTENAEGLRNVIASKVLEAKKRPNRVLATSGGVEAATRMAVALLERRPQITQLAAQARIQALVTDSRAQAFVDRTAVVGSFEANRSLFDAAPIDGALFVDRVVLQASSVRRMARAATFDVRVLQAARDAANAGRFGRTRRTTKAGAPIVQSDYMVSGVVWRFVWELRAGRRSLALLDAYPAK